MKWEELTAPDIKQAVEDVKGVCLVPVGILEKHGEHLPVGTDYLCGKAVAEKETSLSIPACPVK